MHWRWNKHQKERKMNLPQRDVFKWRYNLIVGTTLRYHVSCTLFLNVLTSWLCVSTIASMLRKTQHFIRCTIADFISLFQDFKNWIREEEKMNRNYFYSRCVLQKRRKKTFVSNQFLSLCFLSEVKLPYDKGATRQEFH